MVTVSIRDFGSARLKVEWAKEHIRHLHATLKHFAASDAHRIAVEPDPENGGYHLVMHLAGLYPAIPLIVGDVAHNLSSALDHAWNVLARASRESKSRLTFPTDESWQNFKLTVDKTPIKATFPDVERLMLNEIKAVKGESGHKLWAVRQLDNTDKHNLIITTPQSGAARDFLARTDEGELFAGGTVKITGDGSFPFANFRAKPRFYGNTKPEIEVVFGEGKAFSHEPILPALHQAAEAVSETVELFVKNFGN